MRQAWRAIAGVLAVGAFAAGGTVALAAGGGNGNGNGNRGNALATTIFTMPAADGPPEGVAFDKRSGRFFVSRTGTGAIFAGTLGSPTLTPFIAGGATSPNPVATGLKVRRGLLYVAGASTGQIRVYDLANPAAAPKVFATGGGFINDLDLDRHGNVFATDSTKSTIYEVTAAQVAAGTGTPTAFDLSGTITSDPAAFNLNGIVVRRDGELIAVQSNVGKLWRISFGNRDRNDRGGDHARRAQATTPTPQVQEIQIRGGEGTVTGGDGLLIDRGRLLVGRGATKAAANGAVDAFKLSRHDTRARFESETTDPSFQGPSTLARARNRILVVNPNFAGAANATQFTVTGLARNAIRHGGGGGRHGGR
jgi:Cu-Zn family superoxide dismutase